MDLFYETEFYESVLIIIKRINLWLNWNLFSVKTVEFECPYFIKINFIDKPNI